MNIYSREEIERIYDERKPSIAEKMEGFIIELRNNLAQHLDKIGPLSDGQWHILKEFIPANIREYKKKPRTLIDNRKVIDAIIWSVKEGKRLRYLPSSDPSGRTCLRRLQDWERLEALEGIKAMLQKLYTT